MRETLVLFVVKRERERRLAKRSRKRGPNSMIPPPFSVPLTQPQQSTQHLHLADWLLPSGRSTRTKWTPLYKLPYFPLGSFTFQLHLFTVFIKDLSVTVDAKRPVCLSLYHFNGVTNNNINMSSIILSMQLKKLPMEVTLKSCHTLI